MIERVPYCVWPKPTPTNAERIEAWRRKYALVPIEAKCTPIHRYEAPARQGVPPAPTPHCRVGGLFFDQFWRWKMSAEQLLALMGVADHTPNLREDTDVHH